MKKRYKSMALVAVLALLCSIALLSLMRDRRTRSSSSDGAMQSDQKSISTPSNLSPIAAKTNEKSALSTTSPGPGPTVDSNSISKTTDPKIESIASGKNQQINFWGIVLDHTDNPIPQVRIRIKVRKWQTTAFGGIDGRFSSFDLLSEQSGRFQVTDIVGDELTIERVEKDGYILSPKSIHTYRYRSGTGQFSPNQSTPVTIRMWKKLPSEALRSFDKDMRIPYDGTPVEFDIVSGERLTADSGGGDIRIKLIRQPLKLPVGNRVKFDWSAKIEAINGGIQPAESELPFMAPENGYLPAISFNMPVTNSDWAPIKRFELFGKFRDGQIYSRIELEFRVDSDKEQTGFTLKFATNPGGSRNLQP